jgi:phosphate transport system substrate-binding protein
VRIPNRLIIGSVMAVVVSSAVLPAGAAAAEVLNGSGSTLAAPLVAEWALAFETLDRVKVNFTPTGSEAGIQAVSSRAVDFAASEAPMSASQRAACHSCFQIPWSLTAIGIGYNVRGVGSNLRLNGSVLAAIYLGEIKRWNDPRIQALNHRLRLPAVNITPIYANGSGDTYVFTSYLSGVSSTWRSDVGTGATVSFPTGVVATTNSSIISRLESTNGALAYAGASYLIAHGLPAAAVQNSAGNYEYPNLANIDSAAHAVKHVPSSGVVRVVNPPRSARIAYPIAALTYVIVPADSSHKSSLRKWILYGMGAGQEFGPALDFASLPPVIKRASTAAVHRFSG